MEPDRDRRFNQVMAFHRVHGHFRIPRDYVPAPDVRPGLLLEWVNHQRRKQSAGRLKPDRERRLDAAGFDWSDGRGGRPRTCGATVR